MLDSLGIALTPPCAVDPSIVQKIGARKFSSATLFKGFPTTAQSVAKYPQTSISTLGNGLRVATEQIEGGDTATVGVVINAGTRYEDAQNNGVAHFLEHMLFKGTPKRDVKKLETEIENLGATINAYTSRESTVFYAKVQKADVPQALEILSDMLTNSKIDSTAVELERGTILREYQSIEENITETLFDRLHQTAYRGTPLASTILGSPEQISKLSRDDIIRYQKSHFVGPRMAVVGAGAIEHKQLVGLAEKLFANVPITAPNNVPAFKAPAQFTGSDILVRDDDMPLAHIAYAFETGGWNDPDTYTLQVIQQLIGSYNSNMVGGGFSSSPIIQEIADGQLAESLTPFHTLYSDTGLFGMYMISDAVTQRRLMNCVSEGLIRLSFDLSLDRLEEAKAKAKAAALQLNGTTAVFEEVGRQIMSHGRRIHPSEALARIDAVDQIAVQNCIRRLFYDQDHALAAIGPIWELPDYNFIRRRSYSFRV